MFKYCDDFDMFQSSDLLLHVADRIISVFYLQKIATKFLFKKRVLNSHCNTKFSFNWKTFFTAEA
jgi:hypothetical protein